jgi:hypothetical protein
LKGKHGYLSDRQVDPCFWPEVRIFNEFVKNSDKWDGVIGNIRSALKTEAGRKELSAGFYPGKFDLYKNMVVTL